ncbi:DUF5667 domain-containing protein [Nocardioides marmorisolisilvae]|uniref:DUF5667 domain-containing protein n=1 Tax=Nocardioides marmorisolisilvae TaxID=1542737 RepID=A0A3N0E039_9ACTN|nr:DUF5667 domain-containing protein [Nocardioides marmorisolisilvae]RNL81201.1 hypothetical protein EFL95_02180 [Nocardioides marmorisolisilvae]
MIRLNPARRAAEEFASVVDGPRGAVAERYAELLSTVDVLREQEIPAPRADFVADLRMRLMDAADTLLLPADAELAPVLPLSAPSNRRQRRISIAAAAFVVIGGTAGVAAAAESSLPGDALYPLKRGIESAQVSLNSSDSGKGQDLLRQASTRLDEVDGLISSDSSASEINHTLSSFQRSATNGADLLFVAYQRNGDPQEITRLRTMLGSQLNQLDQLSDKAPNGSKPAFASARTMLSDLDQQASALCGSCGPQASSAAVAVTSAQALDSLLSGPITQAQQAAAEAARNSDLAHKADQAAKNIKHSVTGKPGTVTPPSVTPGGDGPPVTLPDPGDPTGSLNGALSGLTSGVDALLGQVDQATGGVTAPLTTTVNTTLHGLLP